MGTSAPLPRTRPGAWREKVQAWAREDLASFRAHPWLIEITSGPFLGPHAFAWTDSAIRVFDGTGLDAEEALAMVGAFERALAWLLDGVEQRVAERVVEGRTEGGTL